MSNLPICATDHLNIDGKKPFAIHVDMPIDREHMQCNVFTAKLHPRALAPGTHRHPRMYYLSRAGHRVMKKQ